MVWTRDFFTKVRKEYERVEVRVSNELKREEQQVRRSVNDLIKSIAGGSDDTAKMSDFQELHTSLSTMPEYQQKEKEIRENLEKLYKLTDEDVFAAERPTGEKAYQIILFINHYTAISNSVVNSDCDNVQMGDINLEYTGGIDCAPTKEQISEILIKIANQG